MDVRVAGAADMGQLAGLLGRFDEREQETTDGSAFAVDLVRWWEVHQASHVGFVALLPSALIHRG